MLFTLGVSTLKGDLYSRLKLEQKGAGYCHFPDAPKQNHRGYDQTYFKGLLSERMVVKRVNGRQTVTWEVRGAGVRNEPLDTRVYATGALELFNPNFEMHSKRRAKRVAKNTNSMPKLKQPESKTQTDTQATAQKQNESKQPVKKRKISAGIVRHGLSL